MTCFEEIKQGRESLQVAIEEYDQITAEVEALLAEGRLEEANELFWEAIESKIILPKEITMGVEWVVLEDGKEPSEKNTQPLVFFAKKGYGEATIH